MIFEAFGVLCPLQRRDQQRKAWLSLPEGKYEITEKGFGGWMIEPFAPHLGDPSSAGTGLAREWASLYKT